MPSEKVKALAEQTRAEIAAITPEQASTPEGRRQLQADQAARLRRNARAFFEECLENCGALVGQRSAAAVALEVALDNALGVFGAANLESRINETLGKAELAARIEKSRSSP